MGNMPHMKFFQGIADIKNHLVDVLKHFDDEKWGKGLLETWGIAWSEQEKEMIAEELEVVRYLLACQGGIAHGHHNAKKPSIELVNRCFNRHLQFLETIHGCHQWNVNKHHSKLVQKEYKTCRHYLFKFSCPAWVEKLPDEIPTLKNKYPDLDKEEDLPISTI